MNRLTFKKRSCGGHLGPTWQIVGFLPLIAALTLLAPSCFTEEPEVEKCDGTTASVQQLLAHECGSSGCHGGVDPAGALRLRDSDIIQALVGAPSGTCDGWTLVVPGDPEGSLLWNKLYSTLPACGDPMPLSGRLEAIQLACIRDWIESLPALDGGSGCEMCGGSSCVELQLDPAHCGACDVACPPGAACVDGSCECAGTLRFCSEACVDVEASSSHCGDCDRSCPAGALCNVGQCLCSGGLEDCGNACVDKSADPENCGTCGNLCQPEQVCFLGGCASDCGTLTQCGGSCRDTQTSVLGCGACDRTCAAGASCVEGTCLCPSGTSECGTACINTFSDPANCGGCGIACTGGLVCESGQCKCPGGGTPCGNQCIDTLANPQNCGGCGIVCALGQTCEAGVCTCSGATASFANDIEPILSRNCAARGCHSGVRPAEGLSLVSGTAYANLVGVRSRQCADGRLRVVPGDPAKSYLMNKLMDVNVCFGTQMPKAGTSLPRADIEQIGAWICSGAPQN
jgi:hypothetical protein